MLFDDEIQVPAEEVPAETEAPASEEAAAEEPAVAPETEEPAV